jgi:hypothetical protein
MLQVASGPALLRQGSPFDSRFDSHFSGFYLIGLKWLCPHHQSIEFTLDVYTEQQKKRRSLM